MTWNASRQRGEEKQNNRWRENGFYVMLGEDERWVKKKKDMLHQVKDHKNPKEIQCKAENKQCDTVWRGDGHRTHKISL